MPKDLRIEFKVKNAILYRALEEFALLHGLEGYGGRTLNLSEITRYTGVEYSDLVSYLTLRVNPWCLKAPRSNEYRLRTHALKLQGVLDRPAEEIFPPDLYNLDIPRDYHIEVDSFKMIALADARRQKLLPPPEQYEMDDPPPDFGLLYDAIKNLTTREEKIIRLRYGLDGENPKTLEEIGEKFGVTQERIRQIEKKVLRRLRRPGLLTDYRDEQGGYSR